MTLKVDDKAWQDLISLIENYLKENGDPGLVEEIDEFKIVRRINLKAVKDREQIIKSNRDARKLDEALSKARPERELLSPQEQALEMASSLVRMLIEIPAMLSRTERRFQELPAYNEKIEFIWREELSSDTNEDIELHEIRSGSFEEMEDIAKEILTLINRGRSEGWQA